MPNARYQRGRRAEWEVRKAYEAQGATVVRAAGSKGAVDLVAWTEHGGSFIQVKAGRPASPAEIRRLMDLPRPKGWAVQLWHKRDGEWRVEDIPSRKAA